MRLNKRSMHERVHRITLRANAQASTAQVQFPASRVPRAGAAAQDVASAKPKDCRRQSYRVPTDSEVAVKRHGGFGFQLQARNVSAGGCRVELIEMVDCGERVIVRLPALEPLGAEVAWVDGANAGLHFQRSLHAAVFDQLVDRFTTCAA
ncbi:MAG: PilZ domain-containing protein [Sphingomicrobium sp.]